ncbi:MAG: nucleoside phosphorylase [Desulfobacterales bacterium]
MPLTAENCDAVVNPPKSENSPDIGSVAVMAATRADLFLLGDLLPFNKNEFERLFISRIYFNPHRPEGFSVAGPFVGAPYAVMLLETLIARGARRIIFRGHISVSFPLVSRISRALKNNDIDFHPGAVWSTDAVFRETRKRVAAYQQSGILAVDMETSALCSVANFRGVDLGAILVVSDELSSLTWRPGFKHKKFAEGRKTACRVIKELIFEGLMEMAS